MESTLDRGHKRKIMQKGKLVDVVLNIMLKETALGNVVAVF